MNGSFLQPAAVDIADMVELLIPELYPPFQSKEQEEATLEKARLDRVKKHAEFFSERDEGAALARREREEAEISGRLTPDAEAFYELKLKPRGMRHRLISSGEAIELGATLRGPSGVQTNMLARRLCDDPRITRFEIEPRND